MNADTGSGAGDGGRVARRDFLRRPLVDGSQGRFVETAGALVPRQPAAAMASPWPDSILSRAGHWERLLACLLGFVMARLVVTWLTRRAGKPTHRRRRPAMRLSPDQMIFWQHGFSNSTAPSCSPGADARAGRRFEAHHAQAFHGSETFPLAEPAGNRRHRHREADRRGRPAPSGEVSRLSGHALSVRRAASLCTVIPGYEPPTGSLSTTAALALCVFVAVPLFGIEEQGWAATSSPILEPTVIMLPFNIISELSRTLALAVRLFGNMMSGAMIIASC
jgi:F-type H+-transporting ATPase subunit a